MKVLFLFLMCILCSRSYSQNFGRTFYFKDVKWELAIPNNFEIKDSASNMQLQRKGVQLIDKTNNVNIGDLSDLKTLISIFKGQFEYFNSTIRKYNEINEGNYDSSSLTLKKILYNTFSKKAPDAIIDTSTSEKNIDGLIFDKFQLSLTLGEKKIFTIVVLSKLYKGLDFGITYLFMSEATKVEIENMLHHSKFKK